MPDIWIDPAELDATVELLAQQVRRIQEVAAGLTCCELPASVSGRFSEALDGVTREALQVGLAYVAEALDLRLRASEVVTDQAQVSTTVTPQAAEGTFASWLEGMDSAPASSSSPSPAPTDWVADMAATAPGGGEDWSGGVAGWAAQVRGGGAPAGLTPHGLAQLAGLQQSMVDMNRDLAGTTEAPGGISVTGGGAVYVDGAGHRGDLGDVRPDPSRPGTSEVQP